MKTEIKMNKRFKPWASYASGYSHDRVINGIWVSFHWVSRNPYNFGSPDSFFWGAVIRVPDKVPKLETK